MEIEKAIKQLEIWLHCPVRFGGNCTDEAEESCLSDECWTRKKVIDALNIAIKSLREEQEREAEPKEPCERCEDGYYFDAEYGEIDGYVYCPECGRKLEDKDNV